MIDTHACVAVRANWNVQVRTKAALGELRRWLREMQWEVSERIPVSQEPPAAGARQSKVEYLFFFRVLDDSPWVARRQCSRRVSRTTPRFTVFMCMCACMSARACLRTVSFVIFVFALVVGCVYIGLFLGRDHDHDCDDARR